MTDNVSAMFKPNTEMAVEYARQLAERTLGLARAQLDVTENIYSEVSREYRELLAAQGPSAMLQSWPKVLENTTRTSTEGMAVLLKNAAVYQNELFQMMQSRLRELNGQIVESLIQTARAAGAKTDTAAGRSSRQASAGGNGSRTSKAA